MKKSIKASGPREESDRARSDGTIRVLSGGARATWVALVLLFQAALATAGAAPELARAAVFSNAWSRSGRELVPELVARVRDAGYAVELIDAASLAGGPTLSSGRFDLLALPDARELPADSVDIVQNYLVVPGGYRLNEQSDYGILNPDGTDRPVTRVIRSDGARWMASPKPPSPNTWLTVDRQGDARGLYGIYQALHQAYWDAIDRGQQPGLKWISN